MHTEGVKFFVVRDHCRCARLVRVPRSGCGGKGARGWIPAFAGMRGCGVTGVGSEMEIKIPVFTGMTDGGGMAGGEG